MSRVLYRVRLTPEAFGEQITCLGSQLRAVLAVLRTQMGPVSWYYTDVVTVGRSDFSGERGLHEIGDIDKFIAATSTVRQFERGVFLASSAGSPSFRNEPDTEDMEFADLGDAAVEIRAFDTSYLEVYSRDRNLVNALAKVYKVGVESRSPAPSS